MSALSIQVPFPVFQDRDGQPLDNGYVWIGVANLQPQTNPVVAYFDEALTIIAAQPLRTINGYISNAGTPAQIYVDGVNYSILVQDSKGSMVYSFPDGTGIDANLNACDVTYDPPFIGGVPYPVCEKLAQTVSVKDFGAVGDGVTDDSPAIQAAFTSSSVNQNALYVPNGTYRLASQIRIVAASAAVRPQINLIGEDVTKTIFTVDGNENSDGAFFVSKNGPLFNVTIENIQIVAISNSGNCGTAISLSEIQGGGAQLRSIYLNNIYITTQDLLVTQSGGINNIASPAHWTSGVTIVQSPRPEIINVTVENPKQNTSVNLIRYADSSVNYLATYGFSLTDCYGPYLEFCKALQCSTGYFVDSVSEAPGDGVEGGTLLNCVAVNVKTGVNVDAQVTSGIQPGFAVNGTHLNYRDYGVYIFKRKIITIQNVVFYNQNTEAGTVGIANPTDIHVQTGFSVLVTNNFFSVDAGVDRIGVFVGNWNVGGNTIPRVFVANNFFDATFLYAIRTLHDSDIGPEVGLNFFGPNVQTEISNNGLVKYAPSVPGLTSYFYTPTITNTTNIAASNAFQTMYSQNGSVVTVSGRIGIDPTALATTCIFDMDVPIPAPLTDEYDAAGALNGVLAATAVSSGGVIFANGAGKVTAQIVPVNINLNAYFFTYQYSIY
jgi:hypothetical protein